MRKIRAYYRGDFRNAAVLPVPEIRTFFVLFLNLFLGVFILQIAHNLTALLGNKAVDPLVVGALGMRITGLNAYKLQNAHNFLVTGIVALVLVRVASVEDHAAKGAGQYPCGMPHGTPAACNRSEYPYHEKEFLLWGP